MYALKKAISLSEENASDLAMMRQAHLETALLHLLNIDHQVIRPQSLRIRNRLIFILVKKNQIFIILAAVRLSV